MRAAASCIAILLEVARAHASVMAGLDLLLARSNGPTIDG